MPRVRRGEPKVIPPEILAALAHSKLHLAAATGDVHTIRTAIRTRADLNEHAPGTLSTPIFEAIRFGNLKVVKELIAGRADINVKDANLETPLFCAVNHGQIETIKCLLDNGADINARASEYDSALHVATKIHSPELMEILIDRGLDVNTKNGRDETALHIVAKSGRKHIVQLLLKKGADVNAVSCSLCNAGCKCCDAGNKGINIGSNITPLFLAAIRGHLEIVDMLIKAGADVNEKTSHGYTALHMFLHGKLELVNMLLKAGADVNAKTTEAGATPLFLATREGCTDIVAALLEVDGIDINPITESGITPLMTAASDGNLEIVKLLVAKGAPIDEAVRLRTDKELGFTTPLSAALGVRKDSVAEFLIQSGADVNKRDPIGQKPFCYACYGPGFSPKIGKLFLEKGVDVNEVHENGLTFLHMVASCKEDLVECAQFLVEHGANPDAQESLSKCTPLHCAVSARHLKIVEYLITKVKNIDSANVRSHTPLMMAAVLNLHNVVEMLLKNGANPNVQDAKKQTALHIAVSNHNLESVKVLLKYKAAVNIKDIVETTPLLLATEVKDEKLVNLLLNSDADPNVAHESGVLPIHVASNAGNVNMVKALLEKGAYFDLSIVVDKYGGPPLELAQSSGNAKLVTLLELIEKLLGAMVKNNTQEVKCCIEASQKLDFNRAVVNARNASGMTALHYAVSNGNIDVIKILLANGADISLAANRGDTPLHTAVSNENMEITELLLTQAKKLTFLKSNHVINAKTSGNGTTVLHLAAENNSFDIVKLLIKSGAVYNIKNKCKQMPSELTTSEDIESFFNSVEKLFQAVGNNHLEEVVRILEIDSSMVNARDMDGGGTPLYWAVSKGHTDIAKHLLTRDADCCLVTNKGTTPLHIAASKGNVEIVKSLVARVKNESEDKANSFVDAQTLRETTALHAASNVDVVNCLLQAGATYNFRNRVDMTPLKSTQNCDVRKLLKTTHDLFRDVKKGVSAVIDTLNDLDVKEFKAVAKTRNEQGKTLAAVAVASGHVGIASKLLEKLQKLG